MNRGVINNFTNIWDILIEEIEEVVVDLTVETLVVAENKCLMQRVRSAETTVRYHSSQLEVSQYFVVTVLKNQIMAVNETSVETDLVERKTSADRRCIPQYAINVVTTAKCLSDQLATSQSTVQIALEKPQREIVITMLDHATVLLK